jgi:hypothetical protein
MMTVKTSKGDSFPAVWAEASVDGEKLFVQLPPEDVRPAQRAVEFDRCLWLEREGEEQTSRRFKGYSRLVAIEEQQRGLLVTLGRDKE